MQQRKLNILFIAKNVPVKGIHFSRVVIDIAHHISSFCNVNFLYPKEIIPFGFQFIKKYKPFYELKPWSYEDFNISVTSYIRIPLRKMAFWFWNKLSKTDISYYAQKGPFDLIHAHYIFPDGYLAYLYSRKYKLPYIVTVRNSDIKHLRKISKGNPDFKKALLLLQRAQKVLTLNLAYQEFIEETFGVSCSILPHGIDEEAFVKDTKPNNSKVIITTVSEAIKRKNLDWVIKAVKNYEGKQDIELRVIGKGQLLDDLKQLADKNKRIHFTGKIVRSEVLEQLRESDIFALPSYDETFGMVYLEAAATSNAIIGLQKEGVWGVFDQNKEMLFSRDEVHFNNLLHNLIEDDKLQVKLQKASFTKAVTLTWDNITQQYKMIYQEAIASFQPND